MAWMRSRRENILGTIAIAKCWRSAAGANRPWIASDHDLLDHVVRAPEERRRKDETEHLGSLEIDHQLELGRLLDGQVAGLGALEDLVDIGGRASERVGRAGPIGHEAAVVHVLPHSVDG